MKKPACLAVILILILLLSGCSSPSTSEGNQSPPIIPRNDNYQDDTGADVADKNSKKPDNNSTPTEVFLFYFTALQEGRIDEARACRAKETATLSDKQLQALGEEIKNFQSLYASTEGNYAKVHYLLTKNDGTFVKDNLYFVRENNAWKITDKAPEQLKTKGSDEPGTKKIDKIK